MNWEKLFSAAVFTLITTTLCFASEPTDELWKNFCNPPDTTRTKLWWFHGETPTTMEGIDADLESFKKQGVGGVVFYDQVHGKGEGAYPSMSKEWWDALKHAALKARELGLSFEMAAGNGYVAGGPWITPDLAMKKTETYDTLIYSTGGTLTLQLPQAANGYTDVATVAFPAEKTHRRIPITKQRINITSDDTIITTSFPEPHTIRGISYSMMPRGKGSTGSMNIPCLPSERYCGAKYIDYPPAGELEYSHDGKTWYTAAKLFAIENNIGHKSRVRSISFPAVTGKYFRLNIHDWQGNDTTYKSIWIDDVSLFTHDIVDNLEVKTGLRTEVTYPSTCGGSAGSIARASVLNLTEHTNASGVIETNLPKGYWRVIRFGYRPTGARTKHGRKNLLGYEADVMSAEAATVHFNHYFKPICDSLAAIGAKPEGMCMDSHEAGIQNWTNGFERIIEQKHGINFAEWIPVFAGYIVEDRESTEKFLHDFRTEIANAISDNFYGTFARLCEENGVNFTSQAMLNIVNDNLASRGKATKPQGEFWAYQTDGNYDCLDAASAAHIYGHRIASGEAFTDTPYTTTYEELLRIANLAYCKGINEFAVCASSYQPWLDKKYDDSASSHPYVFHRFHPNWASSRAFWDYQARCAYMLRQGTPAVDLAVYAGEEFPVKTFAFRLPEIPEGYNFDLMNYDALANRMDIDTNGDISLTGGMKYKALIVAKNTPITEKSEVQLKRLSEKGMKLIRCDKGENIMEALEDYGFKPDMSIKSRNLPDDKVHFYHRDLGDRHIYFIYNHSKETYSQPLHFRNTYDNIEIWNPETLTRTLKPEYQNESTIEIAPHKSIFIITSSKR